jgi:hypothetical protein
LLLSSHEQFQAFEGLVYPDFARWFYEDEAIRATRSVRQLDRQSSPRGLLWRWRIRPFDAVEPVLETLACHRFAGA